MHSLKYGLSPTKPRTRNKAAQLFESVQAGPWRIQTGGSVCAPCKVVILEGDKTLDKKNKVDRPTIFYSQADYESWLLDVPNAPEKNLLVSIILQAIRDLIEGTRVEKAHACYWLRDMDYDMGGFGWALHHLELSPESHEKIRTFILNPGFTVNLEHLSREYATRKKTND